MVLTETTNEAPRLVPIITVPYLEQRSVKELQQLCSSLSLPTSGTAKPLLIARLAKRLNLDYEKPMLNLRRKKVHSNECAATGALLPPAPAPALPAGNAGAVASASVADYFSIDLNQAEVDNLREHLKDLAVEISITCLEAEIEHELDGGAPMGEESDEEVYESCARCWYYPGEPPAPAPQPFEGPQKLTASKRQRSNEDLGPLFLFKKFIPESALDQIVEATNARLGLLQLIQLVKSMDYMKREGMFQALTDRPPRVSSDKWPPEFIRGMEKVTREDIEVYIGMVLFMGYINLPTIDEYWSKDEDDLFGMNMSSYMSRDRFRNIRSVLQLTTGCELSASEKISSWLDNLAGRCNDEADHGMRVSIREEIIGGMSQWTSHKRPRHAHNKSGQGFTVYSVNDVDTGYTIAFHVNEHDRPIKEVVEILASKLKFKGCHIYLDDLSCTPNTCDMLLSDYGHYSAGTHRVEHGVPNSLRKDSAQVKEKLKNPGDWIALASEQGLYAYAWLDSGICNLLSNIPEHRMAHGEVWRRVVASPWVQGASDESRRDAPKVAEDYYRYMVDAVDESKCDQMRETFSLQRRSCFRWQKLFNWSLEIACANAWGLYTGPMGLEQWMEKLIRSLLGQGHASRKKLRTHRPH
eukprot:scaffold3190_cov409-Prasinococcus_capsulatus_cf.AAC.20